MWYLNLALIIGCGTALFPVTLWIIILLSKAKAFISDELVITYPTFFEKGLFKRWSEVDDKCSNKDAPQTVLNLSNPGFYMLAGLLWPFAIIGVIVFVILHFIRATNRIAKFSKKIAKVSHSHPESVESTPGVTENLELWKNKEKE